MPGSEALKSRLSLRILKLSVKPGKLWKDKVLDALNKAGLVIFFWCKHSSKSKYVKEEYEIAIEKRKDVLPILLDDSQLAENLAAYQWIDLRGVVFHKEDVRDRYSDQTFDYDETQLKVKFVPSIEVLRMIRKILMIHQLL